LQGRRSHRTQTTYLEAALADGFVEYELLERHLALGLQALLLLLLLLWLLLRLLLWLLLLLLLLRLLLWLLLWLLLRLLLWLLLLLLLLLLLRLLLWLQLRLLLWLLLWGPLSGHQGNCAVAAATGSMARSSSPVGRWGV
jgi:hypothetical protein